MESGMRNVNRDVQGNVIMNEMLTKTILRQIFLFRNIIKWARNFHTLMILWVQKPKGWVSIGTQFALIPVLCEMNHFVLEIYKVCWSHEELKSLIGKSAINHRNSVSLFHIMKAQLNNK